MSVNIKKLAVISLKVVSAVVGGIAIFTGIGKLLNKNKPVEENSETEDESEKTNLEPTETREEPVENNLVKKIQKGQLILIGVLRIVEGISSVARNISKIFDPSSYKESSIISECPGYYPGTDPSLPYGTPVYRGGDNSGRDVYWVRKGKNVIEVW